MQNAKHLINPQVYKDPTSIGHINSPSVCKPSRLYGVANISLDLVNVAIENTLQIFFFK